jgi:hypothetical protein
MALLKRFALSMSLDYQDPPVTVRKHIGVFSAVVPLDSGTGQFTAVVKVFIGTPYPDEENSRKFPIYVLSVFDFQYQNQKDIDPDFIDYPIIPNTNAMKRIIPLHLCNVRIWQAFGKAVNFIADPF